MSPRRVSTSVTTETAYEGANVSCIDTGQGLILVDTPLLRADIEAWGDHVRALAPEGPAYTINTDHHFDHVLGNQRLGGTIIMQEQARREMLRPDGTLREAMIDAFPSRTAAQKRFILSEPLAPAEIVFGNELTLHLGGHDIHLYHTPGHTPGTLCVHIPGERVLITGDTLTAGLHPYKGQASFHEWVNSLTRLETLDVDVIVPGHGDVCTREELREQIRYFRQLMEQTKDFVIHGSSKQQAVHGVRAELFGFYDEDASLRDTAEHMFDEGTARLYDEISNEPS